MATLGVGIVLIAGGGSAALAATGDDTVEPVTATAVVGSVTQTVEASGVIASSTQTSASFATNGTVSSVAVEEGQQVTRGQVLAKLDTSALQADVDSASATVASAKQKLEADKTGQVSSAGGSGSGTSGSSANAGARSATVSPASASGASASGASASGTGPSTGTTSTTGGNGGGTSATLAQLVSKITAGQQRVLRAQRAVDAAQKDVDQAQRLVDDAVTRNTELRDAQKSACGTSDGGPGHSPEASTSSTASDESSSDCASARADYEAQADTLSSTMADLDTAIGAQDENVAALDTAVKALDALLATLPSAAGSGSAGQGSSSGSGDQSTAGGTPSGTGGGSAPSGSSTGQGSATQGTRQPASASRLAADQAAIDAAEAELEVAEQNLAAATLTSPVAGTVATVGFTAGSSSSGQSVTILGTGNQVVQITVPLGQIDQVKVGQSAEIAVDGHADAIHGTVTRIGLLSSTSGSLTSFPVTVTVDDGAPKLYNGVGADVTITTGSVDDALLVPNSAITVTGARHTVVVVRDGRTSTVPVTLGLAGTDVSQVTAGLTAGDEVRLADPGQALPSSATTSNGRFTRVVQGGFGAGGFPDRGIVRGR